MTDSRAKRLTQQTDKFIRYEPGKALRLSNGKEIQGSTALSANTNVHFDPNEHFGGHFIQRYGINDQLEKFHLSHEEAHHLIGHLQKTTQSKKETGNPEKKRMEVKNATVDKTKG